VFSCRIIIWSAYRGVRIIYYKSNNECSVSGNILLVGSAVHFNGHRLDTYQTSSQLYISRFISQVDCKRIWICLDMLAGTSFKFFPGGGTILTNFLGGGGRNMKNTKCCVQKHKKSLFLKIRRGKCPPPCSPPMTPLDHALCLIFSLDQGQWRCQDFGWGDAFEGP